jgi:hypothetical protein
LIIETMRIVAALSASLRLVHDAKLDETFIAQVLTLNVKADEPQSHLLIIADRCNNQSSVSFFSGVWVETATVDEAGMKKLADKVFDVVLSIVELISVPISLVSQTGEVPHLDTTVCRGREQVVIRP